MNTNVPTPQPSTTPLRFVPGATRLSRPTFADLCTLDPRLAAVYKRAKAYRGDPFLGWYGFQGAAGWTAGFREQVLQLVGPNRQDRHPVLSSWDARMVAYGAVCKAVGATTKSKKTTKPALPRARS